MPRWMGALVHRWRRWLHPRRRGSVRVVLHGMTAMSTCEAGQWVREAVGAAPRPPGTSSVHAVVGPILGRARIHPGWAALGGRHERLCESISCQRPCLLPLVATLFSRLCQNLSSEIPNI